MKKSNVFLFYGFVVIVMLICQTCMKDVLSPEEELDQKEQLIIDKINDFMPDEVVASYESSFNSLRSRPDYALYLDSLVMAIEDLKKAIELNFTLNDFKEALSIAYAELNNPLKGSGENYLGLGYAKGVRVEPGVSGTIGALIVAGLQASGGGGIKIVYDLVNLERQIYFYSICSYGLNIGVGIAAALKANVGFSGVNEVITGIRYHGPTAVKNSFEGQSRGLGFSVSGEASAIGGISLSAGFGISKSAFADFNGIENGFPCPHNMVDIVNGTTSYSLKVTGSLSVGAQADIMALFAANAVGTNSVGIESSYTNFDSDRSIAGVKMAEELVQPNPINGFYAFSSPLDLAAAAAALVRSKKDYSKFPPEKPSIGTIHLTKVTSSEAEGGGIIKDDGGTNITNRGVCWDTGHNPTISDSHTSDGVGKGDFTSKLTDLSPNTKYYVRAYASNSSGTTYGTEETITTSPQSQGVYGEINDGTGDSSGPDLKYGYISINNAIMTLHVEFVESTFNQLTTCAQFCLDTDCNPATGHPGINSGGVQDADILGVEYLVDISHNANSLLVRVLQYAGTVNRFTFIGNGTATCLSNGIDISVPINLMTLNNDALNFKVVTSTQLSENSFTGCLDYMTNIGQPVGKVR